jgi:hypothetical protein
MALRQIERLRTLVLLLALATREGLVDRPVTAKP